jgi:hypothetical protein
MVAVVLASAASGTPSMSHSCQVTIPPRATPPNAGATRVAFNYGGPNLRVQLSWPNGTLVAGLLPDGGSYATVDPDGSISTKVGWWRGRPGQLRIDGRRLDAGAPPLRAHVPEGYTTRGFQPSGITFPAVGCWRVTGAVAGSRLSFVVRVRRE